MCSPSSGLSAIWLLACDSEPYFIDWMGCRLQHTQAQWYTHLRTSTHTHWWLCCKWREGEGWVSSLAWWLNINHWLSASLLFLHTDSASSPLTFLLPHWSAFVLNGVLWRTQSDHMDRMLTGHRCYHSWLLINSFVVWSHSSRSWQMWCMLSPTCDRH